MDKLIIDYPEYVSAEVALLDGGTVSRFITHYAMIGQEVIVEQNPAAYMLRPYERYLTIDVDMRFMQPSILTVKREICAVNILREGTLAEAYDFSVVRKKTIHLCDDLNAVWPEIELRKQQGATLRVFDPPCVINNPYAVVNYTGI